MIIENVLIFPSTVSYIESEINSFKVNGNGRRLFSYTVFLKIYCAKQTKNKNPGQKFNYRFFFLLFSSFVVLLNNIITQSQGKIDRHTITRARLSLAAIDSRVNLIPSHAFIVAHTNDLHINNIHIVCV